MIGDADRKGKFTSEILIYSKEEEPLAVTCQYPYGNGATLRNTVGSHW